MVKNNSKKKTVKNVPKRNYIVAILIAIGAILLTIFAFNLYDAYQKEKLANSYLMESGTINFEINSTEELKSVLTETPDEYFIYISYTGDKDIYELETSLKKVIKKYNLSEHFYYFNVTDLKDEDNYIDKINKSLDLSYKISEVPTILYVSQNEVVSAVEREDDLMITAGDFEKLLETYEISTSR